MQRHSQKPTNAKNREKSQHKSQHLHKKPNAGNDKCRYCGGHYPHADTCPAKGNCVISVTNATVCRQRKSTPINEVKTSASRPMHDNSSESSNDEYCYGVIPRRMSRFSEIPTHFVLGSCSIFFSVLPNCPCERVQGLSFLLQMVFELGLFS